MVRYDEEVELWEVKLDGRTLTVYEATEAGLFLGPSQTVEIRGLEYTSLGSRVIDGVVYYETRDDALDAEYAWEAYLYPALRDRSRPTDEV